MRKVVFLGVCVILLFGGCGVGAKKPRFSKEELAKIPLAQRDGFPEATGGFVLVVGGEAITSDEIVGPLSEYFRPVAQTSDLWQFKANAGGQLKQLVLTKVTNILLYNEAKKHLGENIDEALEKAVEAEVRKFIVGFEGNYAKAEKALKEMGMDWADFKEYKKKEIINQSYIASQLPDEQPVTYRELMSRYNEMKEKVFSMPATITFRLIDIDSAKLEVADANQGRLDKAKELAMELRLAIVMGEDFGEVAKKHSHGHRAMFGGLWKPLRPSSLAEPYDVLATEAEKLEPDQIAGPIEAGGHIFIMKLEEKQVTNAEPFEKVQKEIEQTIEFERRKKAVDELETNLLQQAALSNVDAFIDFCLEEIYRINNR